MTECNRFALARNPFDAYIESLEAGFTDTDLEILRQRRALSAAEYAQLLVSEDVPSDRALLATVRALLARAPSRRSTARPRASSRPRARRTHRAQRARVRPVRQPDDDPAPAPGPVVRRGAL